VVEEGDTDRDPLALTLPIPGLIDTLLAFEVLHLRVARPPGSMVSGVTVKRLIFGEPRIVTLAVAVTDPDALAAVSV